MNESDSQHLASELEKLGLRQASDSDTADIIVLNTCVVRQSAEDRVYGRLGQLKSLKEANPQMVIGLMGCLVGVRDSLPLRPFVDVFLAPSTTEPLVTFLRERGIESDLRSIETEERQIREQLQDEALILPAHQRGNLVSAHVSVVYGCSHACTFCIIPFRRGIERSRSVGEIVAEVRSLARQGVKEITLLGQIVDRYGMDIEDGPDLADLLRVIHDNPDLVGIERIRFLTSHPNWMTDKLLDTVAELPRVCPHIEVPFQAGDDQVLENMKRGYTRADYIKLVKRIRARIPDVAIHTDVIVGFPGESEQQFQRTLDLLAQLKLDKAHLAMYSPRPKTVSARRMDDDVSSEEKKRRLHVLDDLQATIVAEINSRYLGQTVEVLVEGKHKGKWRGRTVQNKLVFFEDAGEWSGRLADVEIVWTGPWSMQGRLADGASAYQQPVAAEIIPLIST